MQLAVGAIVVAVVATIVAISTGGPSNDLLTRAREAAEQAGTYRFTLKQGISGAPAGAASSAFKMDGVVDTRSGLTRLVLTTSGPALGVKCTYVTSEDDYYTSVHPTRREQIGASWVRSDAGTVLAGGAFQFRPDQLYDNPDAAFDGLKRTGTAKIRGTETTTYRGDLDIASLTAGRDTSPLPAAEGVDIPTVIAIDAQNRLRRLTFDLVPSGTTQTTMSFRSTMELYDYGEPVKIDVPTGAKDGSPAEAATACFPLAR